MTHERESAGVGVSSASKERSSLQITKDPQHEMPLLLFDEVMSVSNTRMREVVMQP